MRNINERIIEILSLTLGIIAVLAIIEFILDKNHVQNLLVFTIIGLIQIFLPLLILGISAVIRRNSK